jgi:hypothetical protein
MSNPFQASLEAVHELYEKNTDYPDITSEDFVVRRRYGNNSIHELEKEVKNGVIIKGLKESASFAANGTGTDSMTTNVPTFLSFIRSDGCAAIISDGQNEWKEVSAQMGNRMVQDKITNPYVFWVEAGNIRTLPALAGTMQFPYLRKPNYYPIGTESDALDVDSVYLQEYVLAYLYLDDENLSAYQAHMQNAKDILDSIRVEAITNPPEESSWGFGM